MYDIISSLCLAIIEVRLLPLAIFNLMTIWEVQAIASLPFICKLEIKHSGREVKDEWVFYYGAIFNLLRRIYLDGVYGWDKLKRYVQPCTL